MEVRRSAPLFVLAGLMAWRSSDAFAQSSPAGEFQVNTESAADATEPDLAVRADGPFVVVWRSDDPPLGIRAQRFDRSARRVGAELPVSPPNLDAFNPEIAIGANGDFVVVWLRENRYDLAGQRFDSAGVPLGSEFEVGGDGYRSHDVAMTSQGDFLVVWADYYGLVRGRRYDATGSEAGDVFLVGSSGNGGGPVAAMDAEGDFVVVWSAFFQAIKSDIVAQRFDQSGAGVGGELEINDYTPGDQYAPAVAMAPDGSFVVTWTSTQRFVGLTGQDGDGVGVFGQRFDSAGARVGPEFQVNTHTSSDQRNPSVAMGAGGDFSVVWSSLGQDGSEGGVFGQRFDSAGGRVGSELPVNTLTEGDQSAPSAGMAADRSLVVAWQSSLQDGSSRAVRGRRFGAGADTGRDTDGDGIANGLDNCPTVSNPDQTDVAGDGYGDDCVSPDAVIATSARIGANPVVGRGTTLLEGVSVGDDAILGELVRLERQVSVGDHLTAGDFVVIGRRSTVGDDVRIGFATRIDVFVTIGNGVTIGDRAVIRRNASIADGARIEPLVVLFAGTRIGEGATVEMGAQVGRGATVRPGAIVPAGTTVPPGAAFP